MSRFDTKLNGCLKYVAGGARPGANVLKYSCSAANRAASRKLWWKCGLSCCRQPLCAPLYKGQKLHTDITVLNSSPWNIFRFPLFYYTDRSFYLFYKNELGSGVRNNNNSLDVGHRSLKLVTLTKEYKDIYHARVHWDKQRSNRANIPSARHDT